MKKVLFFAVALLCQVESWAQGVQTATLHHGSEFKSFYSATAFKEAMAEAQPGDVINLSSGTFKGTLINIPVTIKGAGIGVVDGADNVSKLQTSFSDGFTINVPANENGFTLSMEGFVCDGLVSIDDVTNPIFSKMRFKSIQCNKSSDDAKISNVTLFHCIFEDLSFAEDATFLMYNCVFPGFRNASSAAQISVFNSVVDIKSNDYVGDSNNISYSNCIFDASKVSSVIYYNASLYDCLCIGGDEYTFGKNYGSNNMLPGRNNRLLPKDVDAFVEGTFYRLTDQAMGYLGNDGTQVGIYGTALPFSTKTSYPQIKKFVVSPESTTDGKLKIEIEIDAAN